MEKKDTSWATIFSTPLAKLKISLRLKVNSAKFHFGVIFFNSPKQNQIHAPKWPKCAFSLGSQYEIIGVESKLKHKATPVRFESSTFASAIHILLTTRPT
jgi:hypothetical protein